ncbi:cyclic-di-AMP receptor [Evansella tamaricis]|uniref:Cyclic-di-AMP receptor n=1 Tax=Evansella tamaricis TaxID=2069301 RepID=A0ABS6J936_9BACI|nr:cyclic-di-AMP receptor [Evansella tamaricis]MBU9710202.1 cyclic-di-AMP receptor [Evansella tamaricis]
MKLMICVVHNRYADEMEQGLKSKGYRMTELASSGGFLRKGNTTFLLGIENKDVKDLQNEMKAICTGIETKKGKLKGSESRYTSFLVDVKDSLPLLNQLK